MKRFIFPLIFALLVYSGCAPSTSQLLIKQYEAGRLDSAKALCLKLISEDTASGLGHLYLGKIYLNRADTVKALEAFEQSLNRQPSFEANFELADIYYHQLKLESAFKYLSAASYFTPYPDKFFTLSALCGQAQASAYWYFSAGMELYKQGNFLMAADSFCQACQINREYTEAKYYLHLSKGRSLMLRQGEDNYWDAIVEFGKAVSADDGRGEAHLYMAKCYYQKNSEDFANTLIELKKARVRVLSPEMYQEAEDMLKKVETRKKKLDAFWGRD